jgi:hypothetical protein
MLARAAGWLLKVTQNTTFSAARVNRSFVQMHILGT